MFMRFTKSRFFIIVIVLMVGFLNACSSEQKQSLPPSSEQSKPTVAPNAQAVSAYPALVASSTQVDYPAPQSPMGNSIQPFANLVPPVEAPAPEKGKASLSGLLYQETSSAILKNFRIYLSPGQGTKKDQPPPVLVGPLTEKGDITSRTDDQGIFTFSSVPPGNYYLVVALPDTYDLAVNPKNDQNPLLIKLDADQRLVLGVVLIH